MPRDYEYFMPAKYIYLKPSQSTSPQNEPALLSMLVVFIYEIMKIAEYGRIKVMQKLERKNGGERETELSTNFFFPIYLFAQWLWLCVRTRCDYAYFVFVHQVEGDEMRPTTSKRRWV